MIHSQRTNFRRAIIDRWALNAGLLPRVSARRSERSRPRPPTILLDPLASRSMRMWVEAGLNDCAELAVPQSRKVLALLAVTRAPLAALVACQRAQSELSPATPTRIQRRNAATTSVILCPEGRTGQVAGACSVVIAGAHRVIWSGCDFMSELRGILVKT